LFAGAVEVAAGEGAAGKVASRLATMEAAGWIKILVATMMMMTTRYRNKFDA
jgi:hypothetical protein